MTSATFDPRGFDAEPEVLEPERVSILAILGLVFGLICFIPALPLLGVICAISGLIAINRSRGRLAGTGMAIAGLVLGLLFTALQGALALGAVSALKMFSTNLVGPAGSLVSAVDADDYAKARGELVPGSQTLATDDAFKAFRDAYRAELGAYKSVPKTNMEVLMAYMELGPQFQAMQGAQGRNDILPVPVVFEKGSGLLLLAIDQSRGAATKPGEEFKFKFKNITLITPSQKVINLIDPATIPPPAIPSLPAKPSEKAGEASKDPATGDPAPEEGAKPEDKGGG